MQLVKFPSIEQFRTVVKTVRDRAKHSSVPLPTLTFNGSVKLHGTNSGVMKDPRTGEIWCQSREQIITPENDNAGFARFISELPGRGIDIYFNIAAGAFGMNNIQPGDLIGIYGEWCGQGIQKGVAISQVPKRFVIFGIKVYTPGEVTADGQDGGTNRWFSPEMLTIVHNRYLLEIGAGILGDESSTSIFSIQKFKTWTIDIDFVHPELIQNQLIELTDAVEKRCPVGDAFGVEGIGEGIVWRCISDVEFNTHGLIFKVKGQAHSDTKVTKTATVDIEKVNSINEFATNVVTDHRLEKMIEKMELAGSEIDVKNTGVFLKLVGEDVLKEESDVIDGSGLTRKEVMPAVNNLARQWFLCYMNDLILGQPILNQGIKS